MYDPLRAKAKVALSVAVSFLAGLGLASQFGFTESAGSATAERSAPARPTLTGRRGRGYRPRPCSPRWT